MGDFLGLLVTAFRITSECLPWDNINNFAGKTPVFGLIVLCSMDWFSKYMFCAAVLNFIYRKVAVTLRKYKTVKL